MPEPQADVHVLRIRRVARAALVIGAGLTVVKFAIFYLTNSVAVLTDALESIINVAAAGIMFHVVRVANEPADEDHHYGHGKAESMAVGLEGGFILIAAIVIGYESIFRMIRGTAPEQIDLGLILLGVAGMFSGMLAGYVWWMGVRYHSKLLVADGKHLMTDVVSTLGVWIGLVLVRWTGWRLIDPITALVMAGLIFFVSRKLLVQAFNDLMDRSEPEADHLITRILDQAIETGQICSYHKLRHRRSGKFLWVDMHIQVDGKMNVADSHAIASDIENQIEQTLGQANATAHVEPYEANGR